MDFETSTFTTDDLEAWYDYFDRIDHAGAYHDPTYIRLMESFEQGGERAELFLLDAGSEFVYYPYLVRSLNGLPFADESSVDLDEYGDVVSSWYYGGPLVSSGTEDAEALAEAFATAFGDYCAEAGIVAEFVRFDPNLGNHETFACLGTTFERETVPVELDVSVETLWEGFERRNRNAIRQGQDSGIVVEPTRDPEAIKAFYCIYTDAMEAVDASSHYRFPLSFFTTLLDDEDLATFLVATYEEAVIGGHVVVHDDIVAHDYLRASDPEYWDMRVNNLLCYTSLMEMRDRELEVFDFQGGRPGVFRFKKGFSPDRREFHVGTRIHLPEVYDRLTEDAERTGFDTSEGYFPAYRVTKSN